MILSNLELKILAAILIIIIFIALKQVSDRDLLSFMNVLDSDYAYLVLRWFGDEVAGSTESLDRQYTNIIANANQLGICPLIPHHQLLFTMHSQQVVWAR